MSDKRIYFNKPQQLTLLIGADTTVIVADCRIGKTDSIAAPFVLRNMQRMPGSTGSICVPTNMHRYGLQCKYQLDCCGAAP
jgi:hypothetical protein